MNISLEYYKVFYFVGKTGSFTMAARELSLSQPAVSQSIRHLEEELHTRLFLRTSKGVRLTKEGEVLFHYVSQGYQSIEQGEQQLLNMLNLGTGEIRIGASDMTLQFYLLPYLEKFHESYPGIKVSVTNAPTPETIDNMQNGQIDFGVVSTPLSALDKLEVHPVKEIHDIFIAGRRFFTLKNRRLTYSDLEQYPLIFLEKNSSTRQYIDELLARENVYLRPEFELATSDMIVQFVIRNLGVGYVMSEFAEPYIRQNVLFPLTFQSPLPARRFCIVTRKDDPLSTAARQLLGMLK